MGILFVTEHCYGTMPDSDRPRGILTTGDREFLRGNSSKSNAAERNQRKRIRSRVRNGIVDFSILFSHLEFRDRKQIMLSADGRSPIMHSHSGDDVGPPELQWEAIQVEGSETVLMTGGLRSMFAFSFQSMFEALVGVDFFQTEDVHSAAVVESLVEESLQDAYGSYEMVRDVTVHITVSERDVDLDELEEKFRSGDPVSEEEVEYLIRTRRIAFDEMVSYVRDESRHKEENNHYDDDRRDE